MKKSAGFKPQVMRDNQYDVVYGVHPVTELLKAKRRRVYDLFILSPEPKIWESMKTLLPAYPVNIHRVDRETLNKKANTTDHQGLVAFAAPFPYRKKFFDKGTHKFLLLLDGIQDVRNLGAIIRSAYCTGVDGVILCRKQGAELTAAALKSSAGLAERMEIYDAPSIGFALQELRMSGHAVYVTALGGKTALNAVEFKKPLCVIVGNEGDGVSPESKKAGTVITLPQRTPDISYNASVAAGIVLFTIAYGRDSQ